MKTGKSLVELAKELTRIKDNAKDFIVPIEKLNAFPVTNDNGKTEMKLGFLNGQAHEYSLNQWSGNQLATYSDIPKAYFDRLSIENAELLSKNVNHSFNRIAAQSRLERKPESRMLRTIDGKVRGMLSSRYRILDSHDMLETVFPVMQDKGMQIVSSEVTDKRLFIKALSPHLKADVKVGDTVQYGLVVSTSDVGAGSVRVEPLIYRLVCANGMIADTAIRKFHVGKNEGGDDVRELLSDRTRELSDAAFWGTVRDVIIGSMEKVNFEKQVDRLRVAANDEIKNFDLPRVVELTMKAVNVNGEGKKNSILSALASGNEGAGLTRWGLINAFTRAAQADDIDYESSIEMERAAGQILELPRSSWQHIAATA